MKRDYTKEFFKALNAVKQASARGHVARIVALNPCSKRGSCDINSPEATGVWVEYEFNKPENGKQERENRRAVEDMEKNLKRLKIISVKSEDGIHGKTHAWCLDINAVTSVGATADTGSKPQRRYTVSDKVLRAHRENAKKRRSSSGRTETRSVAIPVRVIDLIASKSPPGEALWRAIEKAVMAYDPKKGK